MRRKGLCVADMSSTQASSWALTGQKGGNEGGIGDGCVGDALESACLQRAFPPSSATSMTVLDGLEISAGQGHSEVTIRGPPTTLVSAP